MLLAMVLKFFFPFQNGRGTHQWYDLSIKYVRLKTPWLTSKHLCVGLVTQCIVERKTPGLMYP